MGTKSCFISTGAADINVGDTVVPKYSKGVYSTNGGGDGSLIFFTPDNKICCLFKNTNVWGEAVYFSDDESLYKYKDFSYTDIEITSGTPGTRAYQIIVPITDSIINGYVPVSAIVTYISDSTLVMSNTYVSGIEESKVYCNLYRASGISGSIDIKFRVLYMKIQS